MADLGLTIAESITAARLGAQSGTGDTATGLAGAAALGVGRFVSQPDTAAIHPGSAGAVTESGLGIALYDPIGYDADTIPVGAAFNFLRRGRAWVAVEDAVTKGQHPFIRITADASGPGGAARPIGGFRSDADGGEATELTRAVWRTSQTSIGGLALVEINLP